MHANKARELKGLRTLLSKAEGELQSYKNEMVVAQQKVSTAVGSIKSLKNRIAQLEIEIATLNEPLISEHAILRWLERVKGVDLDDVRAEILAGDTKEMIKFAKSGKIKKDGHVLVVQDNVVVTIT